MDLRHCCSVFFTFLLGLLSVVECYRMPIVGRTRPPQNCPIEASGSELTYHGCLSACQSFTCLDVRHEPPSGAWPCIRMCVNGWACPQGQVRLDGFKDVCAPRDVCWRNETSCNYNNEVIQVNTNFLVDDLTCRCFVDGVVRCRNAFPTD